MFLFMFKNQTIQKQKKNAHRIQYEMFQVKMNQSKNKYNKYKHKKKEEDLIS
jgi:hypothetical protein